MREIKFRAWDTVNKMWLKITGFETHVSDDNKTASINTGLSGMFHDGDYIGTFQKHGGEQNNVILMQYTGLQDKNGREIYEGDITIDGYGTVTVIENDGFQWLERIVRLRDRHISKEILIMTKANAFRCEVIGNIYEHKYLLE